MEQYRAFRLRGVPRGSNAEDVKRLTREAFYGGEDVHIAVKSLANDPLISEKMIATLDLLAVPETLRQGGEVEGHVGDVALSLDTQFFDFTPFSSPATDKWELDIIALSGLNGHAFGSFKKRQGTYMWLRDGLPVDFPNARILIYGQDTGLLNSMSFQNLLDLGGKLRSDLRLIRAYVDKPIVFIGHSLGGLILKKAINLLSASQDDIDKVNFECLVGLFLFGVPSQGMHTKTLLPMVDGQPNQDLLRNLGPNSAVLRKQTEAFLKVEAQANIQIVNFYETSLSPTAEKQGDGSWKMTGPPDFLVTPDSATQGTLPDIERHNHPINSNHSDLVKFPDHRCLPYQTVRLHLRVLIEARREVTQESPDCSIKREEDKSLREEFLQSLAFREQHEREDMLEPASGTCEWVFSHPCFVSWIREHRGLLWIRGNPGSGKSTVMKRIPENRRADAGKTKNDH